MEKSKVFKPTSESLSKGVDFLKGYYGVKGYSVVHKTRDGHHCFVMTKNSLYRRLIGQVPIIVIEWAPTADGIAVTAAAEMQHGINADVMQITQKVLDIPGLGISRKIANAVTDPIFGKVFCDEALLNIRRCNHKCQVTQMHGEQLHAHGRGTLRRSFLALQRSPPVIPAIMCLIEEVTSYEHS
jgi:hypothetical protein